jgi:hypothetical protein
MPPECPDVYAAPSVVSAVSIQDCQNASPRLRYFGRDIRA